MKWPQITMIIWISFAVACGIAHHGEPMTGTTNAWVSIFSSVLMAVVLYFGGFWGE